MAAFLASNFRKPATIEIEDQRRPGRTRCRAFSSLGNKSFAMKRLQPHSFRMKRLQTEPHFCRITIAESIGYSRFSWNETVTDAKPQLHSFESITDTHETQGGGGYSSGDEVNAS
jgi:hypothetical protein